MDNSKLFTEISKKGSDKEKIAEKVIKNRELISELFDGLDSEKASIKYGCEKVLRIISEKPPKLLYPYFDVFVRMLDSENNFLKWGAIITIANLTSADSENKFEKVFKKYFSPISGPVMISAANVIGSAVKIALAKPELTGKITKEFLKVREAKYKTKECLNVAIGHAIESFEQLFDQIENKEPVIKFVREQTKNTRNAVRKKAEEFLKRHGV
jgi:hypothetical protein